MNDTLNMSMTSPAPIELQIANCPCCGGEAYGNSTGCIMCGTCGLHAESLEVWNRRPSAGAGVTLPEGIRGYEQYPFAWHFGNIKVALEGMTCTGKLPHGCPNCRGLDFCTKRDALKRYAKMEQCWNFWMEDPHHG